MTAVEIVRDGEGNRFVDLSVPGSPLLEGLVEPVRTVEYNINGIRYRVPRSADDPTPDNIFKLGGVYINFHDGRTGKTLADVVDSAPFIEVYNHTGPAAGPRVDDVPTM